MLSTFRFLVALTFTLVTVFPVSVSADDSTSILISEILTGTSTGAGQEFVELYNSTSSSINITGWGVDYKPATSTTWSRKSDLSGLIAPFSYFLVAPRSFYPDSDADWSSTLAAAGGHIRIVDNTGRVIDLVGYGNANSPEGKAAAAPQSNQSIERLPGRTDQFAGNGQDTNDNSKDFIIRTDPEPQTSKSEIEPREVSLPPAEDELDAEPIFDNYPTLIISELFVDPESPLTDADDEYIELYNPNDFEVTYEGYILKGGSNFRNSYVLPAGKIAPNQYIAFMSSQTKIPLSNSGGSVQLFDPESRLVDQTQSYTSAKPGQSWALDGGLWGWSLMPTKGAQNIFTLPTAVALSSTIKKTTKPAAKSTKTKAPTKPKKASTKSIKTKSTKAGAKQKSKQIKVAAARIKPASWLLIVLAVFTIGYAIYEFRHDISNSYKKFRGNIRSWKDGRRSAKGRRND